LAGVTYAEIWALGQKLFTETGVDAGLVMGPHAVGLHHADEPGATDFAPFAKDNLTLQKNMVISVDMPVLGSGLGGTAHLEDLVLITEDGPELLNPGDNRLIIV
jgi:Xaa-Pro aminopeptidase